MMRRGTRRRPDSDRSHAEVSIQPRRSCLPPALIDPRATGTARSSTGKPRPSRIRPPSAAMQGSPPPARSAVWRRPASQRRPGKAAQVASMVRESCGQGRVELGGCLARAASPAVVMARWRMSVTCSASQGGRRSCTARSCSCSRTWSRRLLGPCAASSTDGYSSRQVSSGHPSCGACASPLYQPARAGPEV
jgi:hypothetical protein